jgi:phosphoglycolate phosphatase
MRFQHVRAVLFDLDGTLADSAPDLAAAANAMRAAHGLVTLPFEKLRPVASQGARGLLRVALDKHPDDADYIHLRDAFLDHYGQHLCETSRLFDGVTALLNALEARDLLWGIVTNKIERFTTPFVQQIGLIDLQNNRQNQRTPVVVSGDTTAHAKPHPAPLLHAAALLGLDPASCIYVGDDERDIQSGRAAGMRTVAAAYGYCNAADLAHWGADAIIQAPLDLLNLI